MKVVDVVRGFRAVVLAAVMVYSASGCQGEQSGVSKKETVEFSEAVPFETLGMGQRSTFSSSVERIVYDEASWQELSAALSPLVPFESVDFSQVMLAIIAVPVESGGYQIDVESTELSESELTVDYVLSEPDIDCITPTALAVPFQVIQIRKTDLPVRFERRTERFSCVDF